MSQFSEIVDDKPKSAFSDIVGDGSKQESGLGVAQNLSQDKTPDSAGKVLSTSAKTGLPVSFVEPNVDKLQQTDKVDPDEYSKTSPKTANWLSQDPNRVAASRGSFKDHAAIEDEVKKIDGVSQLHSILQDSAARTMAGIFRAPGYLAKLVGPNKESYGSAGYYKMVDSLTDNAVSKFFDEHGVNLKEKAPITQLDFDGFKSDLKQGKVAEAALKATSVVSGYVPKLLPWIAGPEVGMAADIAYSTGEAGKKAEDAGASPKAQGADAIMHGTITAALDKFFLSGPMNNFLKSATARFGQQTMKEFVKQTALASIKQTAANFPAGAAGSYADDLADRVYSTNAMEGAGGRAVNAGAQMAAIGIATHGLGAAMGAFKRESVQAKSNETSESYSKIGEMAKANKLNELSPEAFHSLVKDIVKKSSAESMYIPKDAWDEYCKTNGLNPVQAAKDVGVSYKMSLRSGIDLKVNYADWLAKTLKTDHYAAFKNDIKFDPKDFTVNELKSKQPELDQPEEQEKSPIEKGVAAIKDFLGIKPKETIKPKAEEPTTQFNLKHKEPVKKDLDEILDAAVRHPDSRKIFTGFDHASARKSATAVEGEPQKEWSPELQGFATKDGKFISRDQSQKDYGFRTSEEYHEMIKQRSMDVTAKENLNEVFKVARPLFENPEHFLNGNKLEKYKALVEEAPKVAYEKVIAKELAMKERRAEVSGKKQEEEIRANVTKDYQSDKAVIANHILNKNKMPNGDPAPEGFTNLKDKYLTSEKDAAKLEALAGRLGFTSASEMLQESAKSPGPESIDAAVEETLQQLDEMEPEHETHEQMVVDAVHDEKFAQLKHAELSHIRDMIFENKAMRRDMVDFVSKPLKPIGEFKSEAIKGIGELKVDQLSSVQHARAGVRAGNEARKLILKGDLKGAFDKKQEELLNHYLYKASKEQEGLVARGLRSAKKLDRQSKREAIGKGLNDSLGQIDDIRQRFGLPGKRFQRPDQPLSVWNEYAKAQGVQLPDVVLSGSKVDYKELSSNDFNDVINTLKNIKTVAYNAGKLMAQEGKESLQNHAEQLALEVSNHPKVKLNNNQTPEKNWQKIDAQLRAWDSNLLKVPDFVKNLDHSGTLTHAHELILAPVREFENKENLLKGEMHKDLQFLNDLFTRKERLDHHNKSTFVEAAKLPERQVNLGDEENPRLIRVNAHDGNFTNENLEHIAMYAGDQYSHDELLKNNGWTSETLSGILDGKLDARNIERIKKKWEIEERLYKEQKQMEMKMTGIATKDTLPRPFDIKLKDGSTVSLPGGHTQVRLRGDFSNPLTPDEKLSDAYANQYGRPSTNKWNLSKRIGTGGRALDQTELTWVNAKLKQIKDISGRSAIRDMDALLHNDTFKDTISTYFGPEYVKMLRDWNERLSGKNDSEKIPLLDWVRNRTTMVDLAASMTTMLKHVTNTGIALPELGQHFFSAFSELFGNPSETGRMLKEMDEMFPFFSRRTSGADNDMYAFTQGGNKDSVMSVNNKIAKAFDFYFLRMMDRVMSAVVVKGAYNKAMMEGLPKDGIEPGDHKSSFKYAEEILKSAKGSTDKADQSAIQEAGSAMKLLNMFYSPHSTIYGALRRTFGKYTVDKNLGDLAIGLGATVFIGTLGSMALTKPKSKNEGLGTHAAISMLNYFGDTVPFVGPAMNYAENIGLNKRYDDFQGSAALDAIGSTVAGGVYLGEDAFGEHISKYQKSKESEAIGFAAGWPSARIWKMLSN